MAINKSIFDKYQKSLLNERYIDLSDTSRVVYMDEEVEIKPLTSEEYEEMNVSFSSNLAKEGQAPVSTNIIEQLFMETAQSNTSFNKTVEAISKHQYESGNVFSASIEDIMISTIVWDGDATQSSLDRLMKSLSQFTAAIPSITSFFAMTATAALDVIDTAGDFIFQGVGGVVGGLVGGVKGLFSGGWQGMIDGAKEGWDSGVEIGSNVWDQSVGVVTDLFKDAISIGNDAVTTYSNWLSSTLDMLGSTGGGVYIDGVTETTFGQKMETSWKLFLSNIGENFSFNNTNNPVSVLGTDPILFGAPPRYNTLSDPRDRSYLSTFIKDGNIISIIPGKPKYNGLSLGKASRSKYENGFNTTLRSAASAWGNMLSDGLSWAGFKTSDYGSFIQNETEFQSTAEDYAAVAMDYLKKNGISDVFNANDKRYYTFTPDYVNYYSYLETMLNTVYTRMGLGDRSDGKNDLFTFFNITDNNGVSTETLIDRFIGKAIGFYFEGNPAVSESVSNDANDPANLKSTADSMSDEFQRINYITGFGVKSARKAGIASARISEAVKRGGEIFGSGDGVFSALSSKLNAGGKLAKLADKAVNAVMLTTNTDLSAITESLLSTNGMKTQFPSLWTDSNYSKSVSVEFEFVSPYGDPLSIFQYCYAPLIALLTLALPKQAEENGYVNPFFLRMDIPGVISSDFAIISNITWVRGGSNNLWTVDRHPRAISVSVTFEDLYQFLAMTKRVSFLSANPNYSMFLDSFSGIRTLNTGDRSVNTDYWNLLVNRLSPNSLNKTNDIWNSNTIDKEINQYLNNTDAADTQFFRNYYKRDLSWIKDRR